MVKVVAFPLRLGRRWAYDVASRGACVANEPSAAPAAGRMAELRDLINRLKVAPTLADRIRMTTSFAEDKMHRKWVELGSYPTGTIRNRIYNLGRKLLSRIEPSENFFKSIPQDTKQVTIVYPANINPRLVRRRLRHLAISGGAFHKKMLYGSVALLPVSAVFAILPLPNVVMLWNLFRAHAHWRALQGSTALNAVVNEHAEDDKKDVSLEFEASSKLEILVTEMSDEKVNTICNELQLDPLSVKKWRHHQTKFLKLPWL